MARKRNGANRVHATLVAARVASNEAERLYQVGMHKEALACLMESVGNVLALLTDQHGRGDLKVGDLISEIPSAAKIFATAAREATAETHLTLKSLKGLLD